MSKYYGRDQEWAFVQATLFSQPSSGPGVRLAVVGERGIGKSEFLAKIRGEAKRLGHGIAFASLDPSLTTSNFAGRLWMSLLQNARTRKSRFSELLDSVSEVGIPGIVGVPLNRKSRWERSDALEDFCFTLIRVLQDDAFQGAGWDRAQGTPPVTIVIDEVDAANNDILPIGAALKTIMEYLDFHEVGGVNIVIAGLPTMRRKMYDTHPSTWREFTSVDLVPLDAASALTMVRDRARDLLQGLLQVPRLEEAEIREDAAGMIVALSNGYPHWIEELTKAGCEAFAARPRAKGAPVVTVAHVGLGKEVAARRVWQNYYGSDFDSLESEMQSLLRLIAIHSGVEVELESLECLAEMPPAEVRRRLASLAERQLVALGESGMHQTVSMRSVAYRHCISQILHPVLDPLHLSAFWANASSHIHHVCIVGEREAPTFRTFAQMLAGQFAEPGVVRFAEYDSTYNLFDTLAEPAVVADFRREASQLLREEIPKIKPLSAGGELEVAVGKSADTLIETVSPEAKFGEVWRMADILCVPHYLLGKVTTLGVWTFEELLGDTHDRLRQYCSYVLHDFEDACTFDGQWIAVPFTYLTKVLVAKSDIPSPSSWSELGGIETGVAARIDDRPGSIALWYEWRQHLVEEVQWPIFEHPRLTDGDPVVSELARSFRRLLDEDVAALQARVSRLSDQPREGCFYRSVDAFRKLLGSLRPAGVGTERYWGDYQSFVSNTELEYMSMWVDWAAALSEASRRGADGSEGTGLYWYDLPMLPGLSRPGGIVRIGQPLESWVFVVPRKSGSAHHRYLATKLAELLISTLGMGWQLQFQRRGGCSPVAWLVHSTGMSTASGLNPADPAAAGNQPWSQVVARAIEGRQRRGKSRREVEFIQAELAFLTALFFDASGAYHASIRDEQKFRVRFAALFPLFVDALVGLAANGF